MITALLLALALCFFGLIYCLNGIHECNVKLKRNKAVYNFRVYVLFSHYDLYEQLPDYDSMAEDTTPLTIENYFPEYKNKTK